ncbi:MAG: hypothetical protein ACRDQY_21350, partial [Pseudonocardiaceae bacterium]
VVDPSVSVVDGFDRWELLLSDVELSDDVREDLVRRLRGVLVGLESGGDGVVSDEEMFSMIERELGID